ncbi:hypothetical protein Nepgr_018057 [Nepenthes gracilis]|uniref:Uncharacterized protein n=1 Tax=Nepenthes gracilis TaxID=150966 RepID=A0AAD3XTY6_NEPGR|nr:hypothetical protein Nepgr_018057 [Nepenthes gracilis]
MPLNRLSNDPRERSCSLSLGFSVLLSYFFPSIVLPTMAAAILGHPVAHQPPLCPSIVEASLSMSLSGATHLVSPSLPTSSLSSSPSQMLVHPHILATNSTPLSNFSSLAPLSLDCFLPLLVLQSSLPPSKSASSTKSKQPPFLDFHGVLAESSQLSKVASQFSLETNANLVSSIYGIQSPLVSKDDSLCTSQDLESSVYGIQSPFVGKTRSLCTSQKVASSPVSSFESKILALLDFHCGLNERSQLLMESVVKNQDANQVSYMVRSICSATPTVSLDTASYSLPFGWGRLPIIEIPTAIDTVITIIPDSDMQPPMTSMEQDLLAGRQKNILTSFQVSTNTVQEMDSKSRNEQMPNPDGE